MASNENSSESHAGNNSSSDPEQPSNSDKEPTPTITALLDEAASNKPATDQPTPLAPPPAETAAPSSTSTLALTGSTPVAAAATSTAVSQPDLTGNIPIPAAVIDSGGDPAASPTAVSKPAAEAIAAASAADTSATPASSGTSTTPLPPVPPPTTTTTTTTATKPDAPAAAKSASENTVAESSKHTASAVAASAAAGASQSSEQYAEYYAAYHRNAAYYQNRHEEARQFALGNTSKGNTSKTTPSNTGSAAAKPTSTPAPAATNYPYTYPYGKGAYPYPPPPGGYPPPPPGRYTHRSYSPKDAVSQKAAAIPTARTGVPPAVAGYQAAPYNRMVAPTDKTTTTTTTAKRPAWRPPQKGEHPVRTYPTKKTPPKKSTSTGSTNTATTSWTADDNSIEPIIKDNKMNLSLGLMTRNFTNLLQASVSGTLDLNDAAVQLGCHKRRIYDITNVLEGIGLIEKRNKNTVVWTGSSRSISDLQSKSARSSSRYHHAKVGSQDDLERVRARLDHYYKEEAMLDGFIANLTKQYEKEQQEAAYENTPLNFVYSKDIVEALYYPTEPAKTPSNGSIINGQSKDDSAQSTILAVHAPADSVMEVSAPCAGHKQKYRISIAQKTDLQRIRDEAKREAEIEMAYANTPGHSPSKRRRMAAAAPPFAGGCVANAFEVYLMSVEYNETEGRMVSTGTKLLPSNFALLTEETPGASDDLADVEMKDGDQQEGKQQGWDYSVASLNEGEGVSDFFC